MNAEQVAAVLARHGVPPDASAMALLVELRARGWAASVDTRAASTPSQARMAAVAWREVGTEVTGAARRLTFRATGRTEADALAKVVAKVLEREP